MENINLNDKYVSYLFGKTHNIDSILKEYNKYVVFSKYNYINHFSEKFDAKIIDIGCGLGHMLYALKKLNYTNSIGIDLSGECVDFCKQQGFNVQKASALEFFKDHYEKFDVIIMNDIIEHLKKETIIPFLTDCYNSLAPNGVILIKTFNATNPLLGLDARYYDFTHEIGFNATSLQQVLLAAGFEIEKVNILPSKIYVYYLNPLNYIAWFLNSTINLFFKLYYKLNGRLKSSIFTKNIIAAGRK